MAFVGLRAGATFQRLVCGDHAGTTAVVFPPASLPPVTLLLLLVSISSHESPEIRDQVTSLELLPRPSEQAPNTGMNAKLLKSFFNVKYFTT